MKKKILFLVLLLLLVAGIFVSVEAATTPTGSTVTSCLSGYRVIYISLSGDDIKKGISADEPVKSLARAMDIANAEKNSAPGFCVLLKRGERFTNFQRNSGPAITGDTGRNLYAFWWGINKPLFFSSYGDSSERPVLYQLGSTASVKLPHRALGIFNVTAGVTIKGIKFEHWPSGVIYSSQSKNITFEDNEIEKIGTVFFGSRDSAYTAGVIYTEDTANLIARNNVMRDMHNKSPEVDDLHVFYFNRSKDFLIKNNTIYETSGSPVKFRRGETTNILIDNNSFYYAGPAKGQSNIDQFGFVRYSGDKESGCPSKINISNNKFYYPYCNTSDGLSHCINARAVRCSNSNPDVCGGVCNNSGTSNSSNNYGDSRSKINWSNNNFKLKWEVSGSFTTPLSGTTVRIGEEGDVSWRGLGFSSNEVGRMYLRGPSGLISKAFQRSVDDKTTLDYIENVRLVGSSLRPVLSEKVSPGNYSFVMIKTLGNTEYGRSNEFTVLPLIITNPDLSVSQVLRFSPSLDNLEEGTEITVTAEVNIPNGVSADSISAEWILNGQIISRGNLNDLLTLRIPSSLLYVGQNGLYFKIIPPADMNEQNSWNNFVDEYFIVKNRILPDIMPKTLRLNVDNRSSGFVVGGKNGARGAQAIEFNCGQLEEVATGTMWPASSCSQTYPVGTVITLVASKIGVSIDGKSLVRGTFGGWGNYCNTMTTWTSIDGQTYEACEINLTENKALNLTFSVGPISSGLKQVGNVLQIIKSLFGSWR